ncbi:D-2-hydroxyacid dehydrogenase [Halopenitus sp. H-Gu1]|uniref:D-2-hydroxyacid dehydrogenase n=1 Tax=Halopenitus sp. H-Gu1 TaxID=3242697 RepID=UPI00359D23BA
MTDIDVLVLRSGTHGLPASDYVAELRDRLPNYRIELARTPQEERELAADARVISSVHLSEDLLDRAENLELFAGVAAGYDHLPLDQLTEAGAAVTNASGIHAPNIAEQVLAYVLDFARNLRIGRERQERHHWEHYQAGELKGSTVTIVGLGAIGTAIADRVSAFDVKTIGVRYTPEKGGPTDEVIGFEEDDLQRVFAQTDYLIIASPLTETTRGLIDAEVFETLPPSAYLVNIGRGPIVETDALVDALRSNEIDGAGLDVTDPEPLPSEHPLWDFDDVTITPHNAGHSPKHWSRLADIVAENVEHLDRGDDYAEFRNVVRQPE